MRGALHIFSQGITCNKQLLKLENGTGFVLANKIRDQRVAFVRYCNSRRITNTIESVFFITFIDIFAALLYWFCSYTSLIQIIVRQKRWS